MLDQILSKITNMVEKINKFYQSLNAQKKIILISIFCFAFLLLFVTNFSKNYNQVALFNDISQEKLASFDICNERVKCAFSSDR